MFKIFYHLKMLNAFDFVVFFFFFLLIKSISVDMYVICSLGNTEFETLMEVALTT